MGHEAVLNDSLVDFRRGKCISNDRQHFVLHVCRVLDLEGTKIDDDLVSPDGRRGSHGVADDKGQVLNLAKRAAAHAETARQELGFVATANGRLEEELLLERAFDGHFEILPHPEPTIVLLDYDGSLVFRDSVAATWDPERLLCDERGARHRVVHRLAIG